MFSDALIGAVSLAFIVSTFPEGENMKLYAKRWPSGQLQESKHISVFEKKKKTVQGKIWIEFIKSK